MSLPEHHREPSPDPRAPPGAGARPLTCRDVIGLLLDYLEEALGAEIVADLERHLQGCAACRAYLKTYERTRQLTGEVTRVELPEALQDRLRERLLGRLGSDRS